MEKRLAGWKRELLRTHGLIAEFFARSEPNLELGKHIQNSVVVPDKVMHLGANRPIRLQQTRQLAKLFGDMETEIGRPTFGAVAQDAIVAVAAMPADRPDHNGAHSLRTQRLGTLGDATLNPPPD